MADNRTMPLSGSGDSTGLARLTELAGGALVQHVHARGPRTAAVTAPSMSDDASATIVAANADRGGLAVTNESDGILYAKEGTGASATDYTYAILPGETKEWPPGCYTGVVTGRLASGATEAIARTTERTW